jgi:hypothetical protein
MSKRPLEDSEDSANKKAKIESQPLNYPQTLILLKTLADLMGSFCSKYREDGTNIIEILQNERNKIPQLNTFGPQSGGKSTFLSRLTNGDLQHFINPGLGTQCPIEIRLGPFNDNSVYIEELSTGKKIIGDNVIDIEQYFRQNFGENVSLNYKIVREVKDINQCFIVNDLPGCTKDNDGCNNQIKEKYLDKPETIIIHIVRGDMDPSNDISAKYLIGIKNRIIRVLTHTDMWVHDRTKINYLYEYCKNPQVDCICLVNNRDNEMEILNGFQLNNVGKRIIKGIEQTKQLIGNELQNKTREILPSIKLTSFETKKKLDNYLDTQIGRQKPDMRELCIQFRTAMNQIVEREFTNDGTQLCKNLNETKKMLSIEKLKESIDIIPSIDILAKELEDGNRRQLEIIEGPLIKKYIRKMIERVKFELLSAFVNRYSGNLLTITQQILQPVYRPASVEIQGELLKKMEKELMEMGKTIHDDIVKHLDMIENDPINHDKSYLEGYMCDIYTPFFDEIIPLLRSYTDINTATIQLNKNKDLMVRTISNKIATNPFTMKAYHIHKLLINFWSSKCVQIHDHVMECMSNFDNKYTENFKLKIQGVESTNFKESNEIQIKREELSRIISLCEDVIKG